MKMSLERLSSVSSCCLENNSMINLNSWTSRTSQLKDEKSNECSPVTIENETLLSKQTNITLEKATEALKDLSLEHGSDNSNITSWRESEALFRWDENYVLHSNKEKPSFLKHIRSENETILPKISASNELLKELNVNSDILYSESILQPLATPSKEKNPLLFKSSTGESNWAKSISNETELNQVDSDNQILIPNLSYNHKSIVQDALSQDKAHKWRMCDIESFLSEEELSNIKAQKQMVMLTELSSDSMSLSPDSDDSEQLEVIDKICAEPVNSSLSNNPTLQNIDFTINFDEYYSIVTLEGERDISPSRDQSQSPRCRSPRSRPEKDNVSILESREVSLADNNNMNHERAHLPIKVTLKDTAPEHQNKSIQNILLSKDEVEKQRRHSVCKLSTATSDFQILIETQSFCTEEISFNDSFIETDLNSSQKHLMNESNNKSSSEKHKGEKGLNNISEHQSSEKYVNKYKKDCLTPTSNNAMSLERSVAEKKSFQAELAPLMMECNRKKKKKVYSSAIFKHGKISNANYFVLSGPALKWDKLKEVQQESNNNFKGLTHCGARIAPVPAGKQNVSKEDNADDASTLESSSSFDFSKVSKQPKVPEVLKIKNQQKRKTKKNTVQIGCLRRSERLRKKREAGQMNRGNLQECSSLLYSSLPCSSNSKRKKCNTSLSKTKRKRFTLSKIAVSSRNNSHENCFLSPALKTFILSKLRGKFKTEASVQSEKICSILSRAVDCSISDLETEDHSIPPSFKLMIRSLQTILFESGVCKTVLDFYCFIMLYTPFYFQNKVLPLKGYFSCSWPIINNTISDPLSRLYKVGPKEQNNKSSKKKAHA